jgi:hypothetical protein
MSKRFSFISNMSPSPSESLPLAVNLTTDDAGVLSITGGSAMKFGRSDDDRFVGPLGETIPTSVRERMMKSSEMSHYGAWALAAAGSPTPQHEWADTVGKALAGADDLYLLPYSARWAADIRNSCLIHYED